MVIVICGKLFGAKMYSCEPVLCMLLHQFDSNPTHYTIYRYICNMKFKIIDMQSCSVVPVLVSTVHIIIKAQKLYEFA